MAHPGRVVRTGAKPKTNQIDPLWLRGVCDFISARDYMNNTFLLINCNVTALIMCGGMAINQNKRHGNERLERLKSYKDITACIAVL